MLHVQALCSSEEAYAGARLLVDLHDAGVGVCEAVQALEPVVAAMWDQTQSRADLDELECLNAKLSLDHSVTVTCRNFDLVDQMGCMLLRVERRGRFKIKLNWTTPDGGDGVAPFDKSRLSVAFQAVDAAELATFLTLLRMHGGELDVDC